MLELLRGSDRTSNSMELLALLCRNAKAGIGGQILIVPEQYSHETERALCAYGGDTISRYAEVLSFTRLAARVFSVYGGVCEEYLDENGRILTLYLAAQQIREQLKFYAAVMTRPDFLKQLGALMEELLTSCVTPDALHAAAAQLTGRLAQKVTELALLYESYLSVCKSGRSDPVTRQMRLCELLDETSYLDGREVFFDGFSDFTALQLQLMGAVLAHAKTVRVSILSSGGQQAACQTGNETEKHLRQLAARQGVELVCRRVPVRTHRAPDVQQWLDGLFFGGSGTDAAPQNVCLVQSGAVQAACAFAARTVRDGAQDGLRYRDFTICMTDEAAYRLPLQTLLSRAGIPFYCASNACVAQHPLIAALLSALQAVLRYEQGPVLTFLKSDFSPLGEADCDTLERYVYYWNIRGSAWEKPWKLHPRGLGLRMTPADEQTLTFLNALRERAVAPLRTLRQALTRAQTVGQQVRAVAAFWQTLEVASRLQAQQDALEQAGQAQRAQECGQLYEVLISTLEQLEQVLGRTSLETELFVQLFSMLLQNSSVGSIPSVCDAVQLTTLPMLRHRRSRVLLVLGADDGLLPAFSDPGGLLADPERKTLRRLGVELNPGRETAVDREMSWVCAALSAAEQRVCLVTAASQPSFLYDRTKTLFPALQPLRAESVSFLPDCSAAACAALQQPALPPWLPEEVLAAAQRLSRRCAYEFSAMRPEAVRALYGRTLPLSASKIDRFAGCRYAFFLQYGLRIAPWKQAEFDAPLFGSFVHDVLEHVVREAQAQGGFAVLTDEALSALTQRCMDSCMADYLPQSDTASRERYLSARNRQEAAAVVMDVAQELRRSQFAPAAEELKFAPGAALPPIEYRAQTGSGLLTGQIDRVDTYTAGGETFFRIIDYKTGRKDFDYAELLYGKNLQMLLYLFALESSQRQSGQPMRPAGVLYVPGRCDVVQLKPGEAPEAADAERRKLLRRRGLVLNDEAVLRAMEACGDDQPQYLPVKFTPDGPVGDLAAPAQLSALSRFVTGQVTAMIDEIFSGATAPNPINRGPADSECRFCDYASSCHKDVCRVIQRRFASVKPEEFWQEIERRLEHG